MTASWLVSSLRKSAGRRFPAHTLLAPLRNGVHFRDIGVVNAPTGRPTLTLSGGAARHLARLTPEGHTLRIDLTLTDEYPMAEAVVIISAYRDKEDSRG